MRLTRAHAGLANHVVYASTRSVFWLHGCLCMVTMKIVNVAAAVKCLVFYLLFNDSARFYPHADLNMAENLICGGLCPTFSWFIGQRYPSACWKTLQSLVRQLQHLLHRWVRNTSQMSQHHTDTRIGKPTSYFQLAHLNQNLWGLYNNIDWRMTGCF